jgi:hypothetical protein
VYARELYLNVRKACCVAGAVRIAPTEVDLCEMMTLLCRRRAGTGGLCRAGTHPKLHAPMLANVRTQNAVKVPEMQ